MAINNENVIDIFEFNKDKIFASAVQEFCNAFVLEFKKISENWVDKQSVCVDFDTMADSFRNYFFKRLKNSHKRLMVDFSEKVLAKRSIDFFINPFSISQHKSGGGFIIDIVPNTDTMVFIKFKSVKPYGEYYRLKDFND